MPIWKYEATTKRGTQKLGEYDAPTKADVVLFLEKKGYIPVKIMGDESNEKNTKRNLNSITLFERVTTLDKILLVRNLGATVRAGLDLVESLNILISDTTKKLMKEILVRAKTNLENGRNLSDTFQSYPKIFPPIFVGLLRAGEASGKLDETLSELNRHMAREYNLVRRVRGALAYPVLLLSASLGVVFLLLVFVLPRLMKTLTQGGAQIPVITRILLDISSVLAWSPILDIAIIAGIIWFFVVFRKTDIGRRSITRFAFKVPVLRELLRKIALVRFTRTLASLINAGMPIIESLHLAARSVGNIMYEKAIEKVIEEIKNGIPFSESLAKHPDLFPRFLTSLIVVGEKTGTLEHILTTFADFYDEEVDNALKEMTTLLEPLLLLFMGLVIGVIALSILLPIYQLVGKFR
ncbi:MAG: type IV pilus assembly protein PilC [Parcubacteria group bacterium LiPW_41]|nr:MAG: type IV pilus assembly protein PilC [Parcubacteria group bacterium LiPW_41]